MGSGFTSLGTLSRWLRGILLANIAIAALAFPANWLLNYLLYETEVSFELIEKLELALQLVWQALFAAGVVGVCLWTWRAWSNLAGLGLPGLRFSPAYAVGVFFIPLLNLYEPLRAMRELYNRSMGEDAYQADAEVGDATAWWGCTLAAAAVNLFLWYKAWFNTNQLVMIVAHWAVELAMNFMSHLLIALSAFFLYRLVGKIDRAQRALADGGTPMLEIPLGQGIRMLESHAQIALWSIWAFVGISGVLGISELAEATGLIDLESGETAGEVALAVLVSALAYLAIYFTSAILIGRWIYRGHANLAAAELYGLQYSPGWAIGWFFIPFANLFKPFGAMRELWNASRHPNTDYAAGSSAGLKLWWGCMIVGGILSNISMRLTLDSDPENAGVGNWLDVVSTALFVVAAITLARIIRETTAAQRGNLEAAASAG